jgi:hypothetical protein
MLIKDGVLNIEEFKALMPTLSWKRAPRWAGKDREDVFYISHYEDDNKIIEVSIRPSLRMLLSESFKNYTPKGDPAPENYTGPLVDWGSSVEVIIDEKFLEEIKKLAEPAGPTSTLQKISW